MAHKMGDAGNGGGDSHAGLSRRSFLRNTVVGAAALPLATTVTTARAQGGPTIPVVSTDASETWAEPWVWRPGDWPGQQLAMNVVENENPAAIVGLGNPGDILFSYNGATPGPTIRMKGDETLALRLRNMLGRDFGKTVVGPYPDPGALPDGVSADDVMAKAEQRGQLREDFCLGEHTNGVHSARDTNIHTHGLHVRPGRNPDGTHSDNVILRVINQADYNERQAQIDSPSCAWLREPEQTSFLRDDEQTGYADYEFRIGDVQSDMHAAIGASPQPHPPGTHWYHPHIHGATHNQVSSGMAGFLIIEGDVDEAINQELTGTRNPDPQRKTGTYDYIERLMLVQRVFVTTVDPDAETQELKSGGQSSQAVNGASTPRTIRMRPGAIERWRVLNGSVDGRGFKRFMVLKGQFDTLTSQSGNRPSTQLVKLTDPSNGTFTPVSRAEVSADKQQLYQLAFDGVTLVEGEGDDVRYTIKDLAQQNAGTTNPLDWPIDPDAPNQSMLANFEACYADAASVVNCYVRPNEVYLAPGNRSDVFFQAPREPGVYTVVTRGVVVHADNYQNGLQNAYTAPNLSPGPEDIIVAYVIVEEGTDSGGNAVPSIPDFDVMSLVSVLPPVPPYLYPVTADEVRVKEGDPDGGIADRLGQYRTRSIAYSGWGAADFPLVTTLGDDETSANFKAFVEADQANGGELELLRYAEISDSPGEYVLLSPNIRTMAISTSMTDAVFDDSDPMFPISAAMGRKFNPTDPLRPRMLESTAEEWAVYNYSISLWADTSATPAGQSGGHYPGLPLTRAEGQARFAADPSNWRLQTKAVDHPFHIHQNPCWVMRIEVPDANGNLVNILDKPRWQDVIMVPRNGGRIVFRSRFPDYVGTYVNHCHILLHEDNGMMQVIEAVPFADQANYEPKGGVASADASAEDVSAVYPRFDQARAWQQSMTFVDPNHSTGQTYPGFRVFAPTG